MIWHILVNKLLMRNNRISKCPKSAGSVVVRLLAAGEGDGQQRATILHYYNNKSQKKRHNE